MSPCFWVNYDQLTATSLESWFLYPDVSVFLDQNGWLHIPSGNDSHSYFQNGHRSSWFSRQTWWIVHSYVNVCQRLFCFMMILNDIFLEPTKQSPYLMLDTDPMTVEIPMFRHWSSIPLWIGLADEIRIHCHFCGYSYWSISPVIDMPHPDKQIELHGWTGSISDWYSHLHNQNIPNS